jgi:hypothetical protein
MSEPYQLHDHPDLVDPMLLVTLDGWVDAGSAMATASQAIVDQAATVPVASFDPDTFIDYRARRPTLTLIDGVNAGLEWPFIEMIAGKDLDGRDLLVLRGSEPDSGWFGFLDSVGNLCQSIGVTRMITIGAYPAAVPHTRPVRMTVTTTAEALADPQHTVPGRIELPSGVSAALEHRLADLGIPAIGLWAQVPHYAATLPYPTAAVALIDELARRDLRRFESTGVHEAARAALEHIDEIIERSAERQHLVTELELLHDQTAEFRADLPSGEELAAEFQDFLRDLDPDK